MNKPLWHLKSLTLMIAGMMAAPAGCQRAAISDTAITDLSATGDLATSTDLATGSAVGCDGGLPFLCGGVCCSAQDGCGSDDNGATVRCCGRIGDFCGEGGTIATQCLRAADCPSSQPACCEISTISALGHGFACTTSCTTGHPLACTGPSDCPTDQTCCPYNHAGPSFQRCLAGDCP